MIVKMNKVSIVVLDSERKEALKNLRKMGLVHLEAVEGKGNVLASFKENYNTAEKALGILDEIKVSKKEPVKQIKINDNSEVSEKCKEIISASERKKSLFDSITNENQELERFSKWGLVDPADFEFFDEKNVFLSMYEIPAEKYSLIPQEINTIVVNSSKTQVRFLLISDEKLEDRPEGLPPEAYKIQMPEKSSRQLIEEIEEAKQEIAGINKKLLESKVYSDSIRGFLKALSTDIEFETFYSGMGRESEETEENAENYAEQNKLAWLTGYVPVDCYEKFTEFAKSNEWAFASCEPSEEDPVPTKLKNNKLVSLIYPLTDFLDVTPGYNEYDISGWFLLFFCIFFAMIFGDTGYGAIITLLGIILTVKSKKASSLNVLIILLGICTMIWGTLTCSLFGMPETMLPAWYVHLSDWSPFAKHAVGEDSANTAQKIFCFVLGLVQLSIAHIKACIRNRKSLKGLGDFGALIELWGMFYIVMNMVVDSVKYPLGVTENTIMLGGKFPLSTLCLILIGAGFLLNFVFSNYEGSIGKSVLESCKNIISVLLGVVNVFSDTVSYIRLWAVALAGAAISETVNTMAGPMFGKLAMVIFAVVLLVFGHGLNIILNLLSVIVHGVRLNTLEFSQHLGLTWSGIKYRPFSEKAE